MERIGMLKNEKMGDYEKASELIKAFNGCKRTYKAFKTMFNDEELEELRTIFEGY